MSLAKRSLGLARAAEDQVGLGDDDHDDGDPLAGGELDAVAHPLQQQDADGQEDEPAEGDGGELGDLERLAVDDEEDAEGDHPGHEHRGVAPLDPFLGEVRPGEVEPGRRNRQPI